jgi:hypothetical protein
VGAVTVDSVTRARVNSKGLVCRTPLTTPSHWQPAAEVGFQLGACKRVSKRIWVGLGMEDRN